MLSAFRSFRSTLLRRREFLVGAIIALLVQTLRSDVLAGGTASNAVRDDGDAALRLRAVRRWGCQYQNIDLAEIERSNLELFVVDHALGEAGAIVATAASVQRLKHSLQGGRRLVLAYLSVGEAETYRTYWEEEWNSRPPPWVGKPNPNWPGAVGVRFWSTPWKNLTYASASSLLDRIIEAGFDGVFLDRVDAYVEWTAERPAAGLDMIALVKELREKARERDPRFLVVGQNAEDLLMMIEYRNAIDGVAKESLFYGLRAAGAANTAGDIAWSLSRLRVAKKSGLPVFAIEYLDDANAIASAQEKLEAEGFVPFFANRALDRMPGTKRV